MIDRTTTPARDRWAIVNDLRKAATKATDYGWTAEATRLWDLHTRAARLAAYADRA